MSRMTISALGREYKMNVTAFSSQVYGSINSAQTRRSQVHFPMKISQPDIQFDVIFPSQKDYEDFQKFVRNHQQQTLNTTRLLTLNWPERNIFGWTGMIKQFRAGGERFTYAPRARFVVDLVNSMVSARTDLASSAAPWGTIYGGFGGLLGSVLRLPTFSEAVDIFQSSGQNIFANGAYTNPAAAPTAVTPVAQVPTGGGGILTGASLT